MSWTDTFIGEGVSPLLLLGVVLGSYLLGCFTTGYYLVRARTGRDIRDLGTGSTGARNTGRFLGSNGFILTMAGDIAKGGLAVWAALAITGNSRVALLAWLAVVSGHIWPAQLGFRGGKGVATSLAGLLIWDFRMAVLYCLTYGVIFLVTRKSVVSSLLAFALLPAAGFWLHHDHPQIWIISVVAGLVIVAHHRNVAEAIQELMPRRRVAPESDDPVNEL